LGVRLAEALGFWSCQNRSMMNRFTPSDHDWTERFRVWVWSPPGGRLFGLLDMRQRGYSNAALEVYPGGFTVRPNRLEQAMYGWREANYTWPVVVVETLRPLGTCGPLFEISGRLARCSVLLQRERLLRALERAELTIVQTTRWGREAPHPVPRERLGVHATEVPDSIIGD
jgi:hypothetical protein